MNRHPITIVGVAQAGFHGAERGGDVDVWFPSSIYAELRHFGDPEPLNLRSAGIFNSGVVGRLAPGATVDAVHVLGLSGAVVLTRVIENRLFGVDRLDPAIYAAAAMLFALVALAATAVPARRATGVDPMLALRHECAARHPARSLSLSRVVIFGAASVHGV